MREKRMKAKGSEEKREEERRKGRKMKSIEG